MMDSRSLEEENMIEDVRNSFRLNKLKKGTNDNTIKDIINLFRSERGNKAIKDRINRDRDIYEYWEDYYKPVRVANFWRNSYIEYKSQAIEKYQLKNILIKLNHI